MTHLPFIAAAYGLTIAVVAWFSIAAWTRSARARRILAGLDRRIRR